MKWRIHSKYMLNLLFKEHILRYIELILRYFSWVLSFVESLVNFGLFLLFKFAIPEEIRKVVATQPRDYLVTDDVGQQLQNSHLARKRKIEHKPEPWHRTSALNIDSLNEHE